MFLFFFLRHVQRSDHLTDFDAQWLKMRRIMQGCAFWRLEYLILTFDPYLPPKCQIWPQIAISSQNAEE